MSSSSRRPSPAFVLATIALLVALGGSAIALPGKKSVDKNDLKKNAVRSKAIKNGQVKGKDIADGGVGNAELAGAAVTGDKLAPNEAPVVVGAPGGPAFSNGGEGDCAWQNIGERGGYTGADPVAFYRDVTGHVHLAGVAYREDGSGGDGQCDPADQGEKEDGVVFTLPPGYQPHATKLIPGLEGYGLGVIVPVGGASVNDEPHAAGTVVAEGEILPLDGYTYAPAR